jgi:hypothetical protein
MPRFQFLDDVVEIGTAAFDHAAQGIRPVLVPLLVMQDQVVVQVGHRKTVANAVPQVVFANGQVDAHRQLRSALNFLYGQRVIATGGGYLQQRRHAQ